VKSLYVGFLLIALTTKASSTSVQGTLSPEKVYLGQSARLVLTIQDPGMRTPKIQIPEVDGLEIQESGSSREMKIIQGQMSSALSFTYLVRPERTGRFDIGPVKVQGGGKEHVTGPFLLEVLAASQSLVQPDQRPQETLADHLFIRAEVSKTKVYVQEPIAYEFSFWHRLSSPIQLTKQPNLSWPSFDGFWIEDGTHQSTERVERGGMVFEVTRLTRILFPLSSGRHVLNPAEMKAEVRNLSDKRPRGRFMDPFSDPFFQDFFDRGKPMLFQTDPLEIEVLDPPHEKRPPEFSGAVGTTIQYDVSLDRTEILVGDALVLKSVVRGMLNPRAVQWPALDIPDEFKFYDPEIKISVKFLGDREIEGNVVTEWILVPNAPGIYQFQAPAFAFLDGDTGHYLSLEAPTMEIKVTGALQEDNQPLTIRRGSELLARNIVHIQMDEGAWKRGRKGFAGSWFYWGIHGTLPLLWVLLKISMLVRNRRMADPVFLRKKAAFKRSMKGILEARKLVRRNRPSDSLGMIQRYVEDYVRDRSASMAGHTSKDMVDWLESQDVNPELVRRFRLFLIRLENVRYGGPANQDDLAKDLVLEAKALLKDMERDLS